MRRSLFFILIWYVSGQQNLFDIPPPLLDNSPIPVFFSGEISNVVPAMRAAPIFTPSPVASQVDTAAVLLAPLSSQELRGRIAELHQECPVNWTICKPLAEFLRGRINKMCDPTISTQRGCEEELAGQQEDIFPIQHYNAAEALFKERKNILANVTQCQQVRVCLRAVNTRLEETLQTLRDLPVSPSKVKKIVDQFRAKMDLCPGQGFRSCSFTRNNLYQSRRALRMGQNMTLQYMDSVSCLSELCLITLKSIKKRVSREMGENRNAMANLPEGQLDPLFAIPVLVVFGFLAGMCLFVIDIGFWRNVLVWQKVYFGILILLLVNAALQIACFSVYLTGIGIWSTYNGYHTLRAVNNRAELLIVASVVIVFLTQWLCIVFGELLQWGKVAERVKAFRIVGLLAMWVCSITWIGVRIGADYNKTLQSFMWRFDFYPHTMVCVILVSSLLMLLCSCYVAKYMWHEFEQSQVTGMIFVICSHTLISLGALVKVGIVFYQSYGFYEAPDWVGPILGFAVSDFLIYSGILMVIASSFLRSPLRMVSSAKPEDGYTPLIELSSAVSPKYTV